MHQNLPFCVQKSKNFLGRGIAPSPVSSPVGSGTPLPTPNPSRHLRCAGPRARHESPLPHILNLGCAHALSLWRIYFIAKRGRLVAVLHDVGRRRRNSIGHLLLSRRCINERFLSASASPRQQQRQQQHQHGKPR